MMMYHYNATAVRYPDGSHEVYHGIIQWHEIESDYDYDKLKDHIIDVEVGRSHYNSHYTRFIINSLTVIGGFKNES